jgi:ankyrin repeat protein
MRLCGFGRHQLRRIPTDRECVRILLDAGAEPNAPNDTGRTPLSMVHARNPRVLELLKDIGFAE